MKAGVIDERRGAIATSALLGRVCRTRQRVCHGRTARDVSSDSARPTRLPLRFGSGGLGSRPTIRLENEGVYEGEWARKTCVSAKRTHLQTLHFIHNTMSKRCLGVCSVFLQMGSFSADQQGERPSIPAAWGHAAYNFTGKSADVTILDVWLTFSPVRS